MQVIYKIDVVFLWIYSAIILLIGLAGAIALGNIGFLAVTVGVELIYLFFALRRPYRRYRAVQKIFPQEWKTFLARYSLFYRNIDEEGKKRFERDVQIFLSDFSVEGMRRQPMGLETKLLVAAGAAAMLHGRPTWDPPFSDGVIIYPGDRFDRHYQPGKGFYAGMANPKGPLILTEGSLEQGFQEVDDGHNVVYHEMAHYFDFQGASIPWEKIFSEEWRKASQGRSFLRPYAGKNEAELFAVAAEVFFENPGEMKHQSPQLYNALKDFFNLDTAEILKTETNDE